MWEYIFDYQQREIYKDKLTNDDLCLLFYLEKSIVNEEFLLKTNPESYKKIYFKNILEDITTFHFEIRQLKNLIIRLENAGYIKTQKVHAGVNVELTFKLLNCLSKKQRETEGIIKYFFLLNWKCISNSESANGNKFPSFYEYYIYNTKSSFSNINKINNIDTNVNVNTLTNGSSNNSNPLSKLFEKYQKFETKQLQIMPVDFDVNKLIARIDASKKYLQKEANLEFLLSNYAVILTGKYDDYKERKKHTQSKQPPPAKVRDYSKEVDLFELLENKLTTLNKNLTTEGQ